MFGFGPHMSLNQNVTSKALENWFTQQIYMHGSFLASLCWKHNLSSNANVLELKATLLDC